MKSRLITGAKQDQSKKSSPSAKSEQSIKSQRDSKPEQSTSQGSSNPHQSSKPESSTKQTDVNPEQSITTSHLSQQHDSQSIASQQDAQPTTRSQQDSKPEQSIQSEQSQQLDARSKQAKSELMQQQDTEPGQSAQNAEPEKSTQDAKPDQFAQEKPEQSTVSQQTELPEQATKATSTDPSQPTSTQVTQTEQQNEQVLDQPQQDNKDDKFTQTEQQNEQVFDQPEQDDKDDKSEKSTQTEQQNEQVLDQPQQDDKSEKSTQTTEQLQPDNFQQTDQNKSISQQACESEFTSSKQLDQAQKKSVKQSQGSSKCNSADQPTGPHVQQYAATNESNSQQHGFKQTQMNPTEQDSVVNTQKAFSQQKSFNSTDAQQSLSDTNFSPSGVSARKSSLMLLRANDQSVDGLIAQISSLMSTGLIENKSNDTESVLLSSTSVNTQRSVADFSRPRSPRAAEVTNLTVGIADEWIWNDQNQSSLHPNGVPPIVTQSDSVSELQSVDKDSAVVDLVSELIQKVNNSDDLEDIATTDTTSAKYVQDEVEKLTKMVTDFVEQSTGIICKEGMYL